MRLELIGNVGVTVIAFGSVPFLKKLAIEGGTDPWDVALIVVLFAAVVSLAILALADRRLLTCLLKAEHAPSLILLGILASGLVTLLVAHALSLTFATKLQSVPDGVSRGYGVARACDAWRTFARCAIRRNRADHAGSRACQ